MDYGTLFYSYSWLNFGDAGDKWLTILELWARPRVCDYTPFILYSFKFQYWQFAIDFWIGLQCNVHLIFELLLWNIDVYEFLFQVENFPSKFGHSVSEDSFAGKIVIPLQAETVTEIVTVSWPVWVVEGQ